MISLYVIYHYIYLYIYKLLLKNESKHSLTDKYCYTDLVVLAAIYGFFLSQYLTSHCRNMHSS